MSQQSRQVNRKGEKWAEGMTPWAKNKTLYTIYHIYHTALQYSSSTVVLGRVNGAFSVCGTRGSPIIMPFSRFTRLNSLVFLRFQFVFAAQRKMLWGILTPTKYRCISTDSPILVMVFLLKLLALLAVVAISIHMVSRKSIEKSGFLVKMNMS